MNPYILLIIAFVLVFLEFFLPGGILGIFGAFFVVLSLVAFYLEGHSPLALLAYFTFVVVALAILIRYILKAIQSTGKENTIMLDDDQEGYVATGFDKSLIGKTGTVLADLRPAGKIVVDGIEVQALSEMGYLSKGTEVQIVGGKGSHLIVKKA
jgi:Membrane-bound serine protease (ClpP class)